MNYHLEGVFHADKSRAVKDMWWVWSDLTPEEIESVQGVAIDNEKSHPLYGCAIRVDPRFSEDKVLGKLMELAQEKHKSTYCQCIHDTMTRATTDKVYACGDIHIGSHKFHIACDSAMDKDQVRVVAVCNLGDTVDNEVKVITYNGKLYYVEGEVGPNYIAVKREDLEEWHRFIKTAREHLYAVTMCRHLDHASRKSLDVALHHVWEIDWRLRKVLEG